MYLYIVELHVEDSQQTYDEDIQIECFVCSMCILRTVSGRKIPLLYCETCLNRTINKHF